jgi:uncharacterized protein (TIGR00369 family)
MHFGDVLGLEHVETGNGRAVVEVAVTSELFNRHGTVHGGVLMTIMDVAGLWAGCESGAAPRASTISLTCNFLASAALAPGERLRAVAEVVKRGRSLYFSTITVSSAAGHVLCVGQSVYRTP